MRRPLIFLQPFWFFFLTMNVLAQNKAGIVSGPMLGQVESRTACIWVEVTNTTKSVSLRYWKKADPESTRTKVFPDDKVGDFKPVQIEIGGLDFNTTYQYMIMVNGVDAGSGGEFTTKDLWQWRKPVPDFSFLTGSCAYYNEPAFDRKFTNMISLDQPARPYGGDSSIFEAMARTPAAFMLWLGDNWYTRDVDYNSKWGLWYRASRDRSQPALQHFLKVMPHYAIWDDHDYGPDNANKSYALKEESRKIFSTYWCNPSYGENGQGIYSKITYGDADFFLLDDRYFRSSDNMEAMIGGKPNPSKRMWGPVQVEWLKNGLINSLATFKFIVTGSQVLNPVATNDCLQHYPVEFNELIQFLGEEKISGILFLTGDTHRSEIIQHKRAGSYTLYDITTSPLTAGVSRLSDNVRNNAFRLPGTLVEVQNFSRISISGKAGERTLKVEYLGISGGKLAEWSVNENELNIPVEKK